jgi:hypothetical protein
MPRPTNFTPPALTHPLATKEFEYRPLYFLRALKSLLIRVR